MSKLLEKTLRELNGSLNLGGACKVADVKIVRGKIRVSYYNQQNGKNETRLLSRREAEKIIDDIYKIYGLTKTN